MTNYIFTAQLGTSNPAQKIIYYPLCAVFDPYRIYGAGYILFVYNGATVPWITSINNFRFFINILDTVLPTNMYYISLER